MRSGAQMCTDLSPSEWHKSALEHIHNTPRLGLALDQAIVRLALLSSQFHESPIFCSFLSHSIDLEQHRFSVLVALGNCWNESGASNCWRKVLCKHDLRNTSIYLCSSWQNCLDFILFWNSLPVSIMWTDECFLSLKFNCWFFSDSDQNSSAHLQVKRIVLPLCQYNWQIWVLLHCKQWNLPFPYLDRVALTGYICEPVTNLDIKFI